MVAAGQLYALGLSKDQVHRVAQSGWLTQVHRGVYAVGATISEDGLRMAAALAAGPRSALSHRSAGRLWRILASTGDSPAPISDLSRIKKAEPIEVVVENGRGAGNRAGLIVHRSRTLLKDEISCVRGIPVTCPARTLLDLSTVLTARALERAIDEAERLRLCTQDDLSTCLHAHRGEPGTGILVGILAEHAIGSTLTRTELEERFLSMCRARGLPQPAVNSEVMGLTVDFLWRSERLVAEVDGRASHDTRRGFQDDRDRDSLLATEGYLTLRFTWWDVLRRPAIVSHRVASVLRRRKVSQGGPA